MEIIIEENNKKNKKVKKIEFFKKSYGDYNEKRIIDLKQVETSSDYLVWLVEQNYNG